MYCGFGNSFLVTRSGEVWSCGREFPGSPTNYDKQFHVNDLLTQKQIVQIGQGNNFSIFLNREGKVYSCAKSIFPTACTQNMEEMKPLPIISSICCGDTSAAALDQQGNIYFFSLNFDLDKLDGPFHVPNLTDVESIAANAKQIFALKNGEVFSVKSPDNVVVLGGLPPISSIFSSLGDNLYLIDKENNIWAFGSFDYGQRGFYREEKPVQIEFSGIPIMISSSSRHAILLDSNGDVWGRGSNDFRQIHLQNVLKFASSTNSFVKIPNLKNIESICVGRTHSLVCGRDGSVIGFGSNQYNEISPDTQESMRELISFPRSFFLHSK